MNSTFLENKLIEIFNISTLDEINKISIKQSFDNLTNDFDKLLIIKQIEYNYLKNL
jgi:hypothetical protein